MTEPKFSDLLGQTLTSIEGGVGDEVLTFHTSRGGEYRLHHVQDCCEYVHIEDICGDLANIIGMPLLLAEEVVSRENPPGVDKETLGYQDSFTWTFYKLATIKGNVTIRWYGFSNGYYSESVGFTQDVEPTAEPTKEIEAALAPIRVFGGGSDGPHT